MYIAINTEEIAFAESMIIGQAMNLVPPLFLHHRSRYITNIVNSVYWKSTRCVLFIMPCKTWEINLLLYARMALTFPSLGNHNEIFFGHATFKTGTLPFLQHLLDLLLLPSHCISLLLPQMNTKHWWLWVIVEFRYIND